MTHVAARSVETRSTLPLVLIVGVLVALSILYAPAVLITAPALLLVGVRTVHGSADPVARTLGWLAITVGLLLIVVAVVAVIALMPASAGAIEVPAVWDLPAGAP